MALLCIPPLYTKTIGRPKKNRKKDPSEKNGKLTKHGVTMHCSLCKSADHNKNGQKNHIATTSRPEGTHEEELDDPSILAVSCPLNRFQYFRKYCDMHNVTLLYPFQIMPHDGIYHADPSEMPDSMVYNLLHEVRKLPIVLSQLLMKIFLSH
jgi:hypothetical protein